MRSRYIGIVLLVAVWNSIVDIVATFPLIDPSRIVIVLATYLVLTPIWTYVLFTEEKAPRWAKLSVVFGLLGFGLVFVFSAAGLWLSRHRKIPCTRPDKSGAAIHARRHKRPGPSIQSNFVRWSGVALAAGSVLEIALEYFSFPASAYGYHAAALFAVAGFLLVGLVGVHTLYDERCGQLGWTAIVMISTGLFFQGASMLLIFLPGTDRLLLAVYETGWVVRSVGLVLFGLALNRTELLPYHAGTVLIIATVVGPLVPSRVPVALFLCMLAYGVFTGRVVKLSPT